MLIDLETRRPITQMPHSEQFTARRRNLSDRDYDLVFAELNRLIDEKEEQVHTSSWMPGSDWTGTVFEPLSRACGRDFDQSRLFFGQIVWRVFQERGEEWFFVQSEGVEGKTYFRDLNSPSIRA